MTKVEFTEAELKALYALMDAGVKQIGLQIVLATAGLIEKLKIAEQQSKTEQEINKLKE